MATIQDIDTWIGQTLHDSDGDKVGEITEVYLAESGQPEFIAVKTGMFGSSVTLVPIRGASSSGDEIRVPYDKALIKDAPSIDADEEISADETRRLYEHYSLHYDGTRADAGAGADLAGEPTVGHDVSGPETDQAMTRSEEELRVGTTQREAGRARLRKYVVTEQVQKTVPVQREEVRIEREPITDANVGDATSGPEISEEEHEVVLHEEEAVVDKRTVPKERVRLDKETVTEQQTVSEDVRKEQIETDDAVDAATRDRR